jgi:hypothetical protein
MDYNMPTSSGPNTAAESNIIFSYDTGDVTNSYRGEPTTNLYTTLGFSFYQAEGGHSATRTTGAAPGLNLPTNYDYHTITTTSSWETESKRLIIWPNNSLSSSTTYYVSFWARVISQPTAQIGSAFYGRGLENTLTLTSQWQRFSFSSLTHSLFRALEVGSKDGALIFQIAGIQIESKSHVTPYVNGTRSSTQGLVPLIGNTSINLSNISFNSAAQITYDGTDDHIDLGSLGTIGTTYSIECVFNSSNVVNYRNVFDMNYATYSGVTGNVGPRLEQYSDGTITVIWSGVTNNNSIAVNTPVIPISANTNYHMAFTQDGNKGLIYLNGAYKSQNSNTYGYVQTFGDANLGRGFELAGDRYYAGSLPLFKIYNVALSAEQIKQNYNQYKTRFNLS